MQATLTGPYRKPAITGGNDRATQADFGGLALVKLSQVEPGLISRVSFTGALNECLRQDGREDQEIAAAIHISKGYLSKLLRSAWAAQAKRLVAFMRATRCVAPLQWIAWQMGYELSQRRKTEDEIREEVMQELRGRAA